MSRQHAFEMFKVIVSKAREMAVTNKEAAVRCLMAKLRVPESDARSLLEDNWNAQ